MAESAGVAVFVLPLALWQLQSTGYQVEGRDLARDGDLMGVFCTAIGYTLWNKGTKRVRVEHVTILGFLAPVASSLYAVFLVAERPTVWTVVGGALILGAGLLVVIFGRGEGRASIAAAAEAEPAVKAAVSTGCGW